MMNLVNAVDNTIHEFLYRGTDAVDVFCKKIYEMRDEIKEKTQEKKEIKMTDQNKKNETATHCFICGDKFKNSYKNEKEAEKYRDHCHFTGKYRGCAHSICNLKYCNKHFKIPVFFHHMKTYERRMMDI